MQKSISFRNGVSFDFIWRKDFRFIGFITDCGFGKYIGLQLDRKRYEQRK